MTGTTTFSQTFTITNAKYLASKVKTDLQRIKQFYGEPTDQWIGWYEEELTAFLAKGYLGKVTYGFKRTGIFISPTLEYTAEQLASTLENDRPGAIAIGANVAGATFTSFLEYSSAWSYLTKEEKTQFKASLPFQRSTQDVPAVNGYYESDKSYSSGGTALARKSLKAWS